LLPRPIGHWRNFGRSFLCRKFQSATNSENRSQNAGVAQFMSRDKHLAFTR
jgi:hypothetical protein